MAYWLDWLRYRFWASGLSVIVVLLFIVALIMVFFFQRDIERKSQEGILVSATITKIGFGVSKYRPGVMAGVTAEDDTGLVASESVEAAFVAGCKVGDKIKAKRAGSELILEPMPCR
ncbi:hypothetical protein [Sphingomonas sp. Root710]|uniref:hypothetical protein n=1 Tax=Sphingomonas sp. Root710 TaxID=1736594 RepID=UPI000AF40993|nr:hypothetical protein [Sphingomonas sp. Root710]